MSAEAGEAQCISEVDSWKEAIKNGQANKKNGKKKRWTKKQLELLSPAEQELIKDSDTSWVASNAKASLYAAIMDGEIPLMPSNENENDIWT